MSDNTNSAFECVQLRRLCFVHFSGGSVLKVSLANTTTKYPWPKVLMAVSTLASGEWPQNLLCGRVVYLHDVGYVWLVRSLPTGTNICDDDLANATIFLAGRKHVCLLCWTHSTNSSGKFAPHSDGHSGKGESRCDTMSANMRQSISRTSKVPVVDLGWDTVMHRYFTRCETVNGPQKMVSLVSKCASWMPLFRRVTMHKYLELWVYASPNFGSRWRHQPGP